MIISIKDLRIQFNKTKKNKNKNLKEMIESIKNRKVFLNKIDI